VQRCSELAISQEVFDMEINLGLLLLVYLLPLTVAWVVIYKAVLAALRRHDRDSAGNAVGARRSPHTVKVA
jgi:hypothetical protein